MKQKSKSKIQRLDSLNSDIADQEAIQQQLQKKIDLQNENIDNINTIINDLNNKINEKEEKSNSLKLIFPIRKLI